jgi:hypothetical protein
MTFDTRQCANFLGWFSLALGVTELIAAKPLVRTLGLRSPSMMRAFGAREVLAGVGLLTRRTKGPWIWARLAGDVLDVATLGAAMSPRNGARRNAAIAMAVVAPIVALDAVCGAKLGLSA